MSARRICAFALLILILAPAVAADPSNSSSPSQPDEAAVPCPLIEVRQPLPGHVEPQVFVDPFGCWQRRVLKVTNYAVRTVNELING
ncbi:MAG: hypothetical protein AABX89_02045 [Candidatus Thermoplasmatota archaeon]